MFCIAAVPGSAPPPEVKLPTLSPWLEEVATFPGAPPSFADETAIFIFSSMPVFDGFGALPPSFEFFEIGCFSYKLLGNPLLLGFGVLFC